MFIPSLQKHTRFKPLTIEQYLNIVNSNFLNSELNLGFNISFITAILENNLDNIPLTVVDKFFIGLQIHLNELHEKNIDLSTKNITHPNKKTLNINSYTFNLQVPTIQTDLEMSKFIIENKILDANDLLYCEIIKHIDTIYFNNTNLNFSGSIFEKITLLKKISPKVLVNCMAYIDTIKNNIKQHYYILSNNTELKYNIFLLTP